MQSNLGIGGSVKATVRRAKKAPLFWRLRNCLTTAYILGWLYNGVAKLVSRITGLPVMTSTLRLRVVYATGDVIDYGVVSRRVITTAFVNFLVDQLQTESTEIGDFKFHDSGVGTTAAVVGDTDIETTDGESRVTGSQTEGASANIYRSVGTIAYTTTKAITEHGLFSQSTGGTLLDRHVFSAINVSNGDSIEFTYDLTVSSGG